MQLPLNYRGAYRGALVPRAPLPPPPPPHHHPFLRAKSGALVFLTLNLKLNKVYHDSDAMSEEAPAISKWSSHKCQVCGQVLYFVAQVDQLCKLPEGRSGG